MSQHTETIKANKFHLDTGYRVKNYSQESWLLTNKNGDTKFIPKSVTQSSDLDNGNVEILIEGWWYVKNTAFFIT